MFSKLKQIKDMRDQAKQMKEMLDKIVIVGQSGDIMVSMNGSHEILSIDIGTTTDKSSIESGLKNAIADAQKKLQGELLKQMQSMEGGLDALKNLGLG